MTNNPNFIKLFTNNFQERISDDLLCVICKSIIIYAHQGLCGCKYCKQCMDEYFINDKKCPGRKPECRNSDKNSLVVDHGTNVRLNHLKVKCLNKNCEFVGELCDMESHMVACRKMYVNCPFSVVGCLQNEINRENMPIHLANSNLDHNMLLMEYLKDFKNDSRQKVEKIMEKMNNFQSDFEAKLNLWSEETKKNENKLFLLNERLSDCAKKEQMQDAKIKEFEQMIVKNLNEFNEFKEAQKCQDVIEESRLIIEYMKNQKLLKSVKRMQQMDLLTSKIDKLETIVKMENIFTWKVNKITEKIKSAKLGKSVNLFSKPFFAYKNGYRLRLRLTPNGYKAAQGKFMSAFFCLEKGEYDELISWPIKDEIIIDLINQDNGNSYVSLNLKYETAVSDDKSSFDRPSENPQYYGNYRFIEISELSKSFLVKNDTIILTCHVRF